MRITRFFLAALLMCAPLRAFAQAALPELPRDSVATAMPATTRVIRVSATGDLQAALDSAKGGDALELACGATYSGHFRLPAKTSPGWIVVRPACAAQLPAPGTRITPAVAASVALPRVVTANYEPAIRTMPGAHQYRLIGLEVTLAPAPAYNYGLILLGGGNCDEEHQCTLADVPHDLVLDRVYVHGVDSTSVKRCVALNSAATAIIDSYLSACHGAGQDAQAAGGWNGPGPFVIANNYLEGSGENVMFGGADPSIRGLIPSDITIRGNHIAKPTSWHGGPWLIKNLLELKIGQRVLIEGNVFENNWQNGQEGAGVVMWSANQSGTATWTVAQDITFRQNVVRNVGAGFQLSSTAAYQSVPAQRIAIINNLVYGIDAPGFEGNGRAFQVGGAIKDVTISHNTVLGATLTALTLGAWGTSTQRLDVTDNILSGGAYGIIGDNGGVGTASWSMYAPDGRFQRNVLIVAPEYAAMFPAGNAYPASLGAIGFVNLAAGDFRLASTSAYQGAGASVDSVLAATGSAVTGTSSPLPTPRPVPVPALTLDQVRAAIVALDKATSPTGRENLSTKTALVPVNAYLKALLTAITSGVHP